MGGHCSGKQSENPFQDMQIEELLPEPVRKRRRQMASPPQTRTETKDKVYTVENHGSVPPPIRNHRYDMKYPHPVADESLCIRWPNVPILSWMRNPNARLESFDLWPVSVPMSPEVLVENGFFHNRQSDLCTCYMCGLVLWQFESGDNIRSLHLQFSPKCEIAILRAKERKLEVPRRRSKRSEASARWIRKMLRSQPKKTQDLEEVVAAMSTEEVRSELIEQKLQLLCKICYDKPCNVIFSPCGHFISCGTCMERFHNCPFCQQRITDMIKVFR
jgi:hypothetical protein